MPASSCSRKNRVKPLQLAARVFALPRHMCDVLAFSVRVVPTRLLMHIARNCRLGPQVVSVASRQHGAVLGSEAQDEEAVAARRHLVEDARVATKPREAVLCHLSMYSS
eukprot:2035269-Pyramimonas_sp.AAC.1